MKVLAVEVDCVLKMLKSKKGISPILATLLLIVIAVAAIIVTYAWVMTFTGAQTQEAGLQLVYENVQWPSNTTINVVIRNTGTSNGKITAAYIGTSSTNLAPADVSSPSFPANINAGSSVTVTLVYDWNPNIRYYFKFTTDTPISLEFQWVSP